MKCSLLTLGALLCLAPGALAQSFTAPWAWPRQVTVAELPDATVDPVGADSNGVRLVTDGASATDCLTGGGSTLVLCWDSGVSWTAIGNGAGGGVTDHGALTGLEDDDHGLYALDSDLSTHAGNASAHHAKTTAASEITSGVLAHERGGLEADVSAYAGLVAISGGLTSNVTDLAALNTAIGSGLVTGAHFTPNADPGVDHASYVAGHGDGTDCDPGEYARGGDAAGNATGCTPDDAGTDDQTGAEIPLTDTGAFFTTDNAEAALQQVGPTMTDARTPTAHRDSHETAGSDPLVDLAGEVITSGTVADARIAPTIARDSEVPSLETDPGVPLLALADLGDLCAGGESTRRNVGDTANECYAPSVGGSGDVVGPASATDNAIARFDLTTGKLIQNSGVTIDDSANLTTGKTITVGGTLPRTISFATGADAGYVEYATGGTTTIRGSDVSIRAKNTTKTVILGEAGGTSFAELGAGAAKFNLPLVNVASTATCTDSGDGNPGAVTITPTTSFVTFTNSDADGCASSLSETGAVSGQSLEVVVMSTAGGSVTFSDSAGVQETGAGCALSLHGAATFRYATDRWILTGCVPAN